MLKRCCDGPHVLPCGPVDADKFYCACGCAGDDTRCWLDQPYDDELDHDWTSWK